MSAPHVVPDRLNAYSFPVEDPKGWGAPTKARSPASATAAPKKSTALPSGASSWACRAQVVPVRVNTHAVPVEPPGLSGVATAKESSPAMRVAPEMARPERPNRVPREVAGGEIDAWSAQPAKPSTKTCAALGRSEPITTVPASRATP